MITGVATAQYSQKGRLTAATEPQLRGLPRSCQPTHSFAVSRTPRTIHPARTAQTTATERVRTSSVPGGEGSRGDVGISVVGTMRRALKGSG
jgi:hypothetical protein